MPQNWLSTRGAIYHYSPGAKGDKYSLEPDVFKKQTPYTAILFTGYSLNETEIVAKNACLNDQRVMYTFGKGFGDITVNGEILIGAPSTEGSDSESKLLEFYEENRVSNKKKETLKLSVANESEIIPFYLVGMSIMQYNVALEILGFRLIGVLAK